MAKTLPGLKITTDPNNPEPPEVMARSIVEVAEGARKLLGSRLNKRAVIVLLKDATGETMVTIERILDAAARLDKTYLKLLAVVVLACAFSACAGVPAKVAYCNDAPTWTTKQPGTGEPIGIFICFGDNNHLLYSSKELPPAPAASAATPQAPVEAHSAALRKTARRKKTKARMLSRENQEMRRIGRLRAEADRRQRIAAEQAKQSAAIARANQAAQDAVRP